MNVSRHLDESQRAMVAARLANLGEGRPGKTASIDAVSQPQAAERLNVSRPSVQRAAAVLDKGTPAGSKPRVMSAESSSSSRAGRGYTRER
jgi:hypothetical protein